MLDASISHFVSSVFVCSLQPPQLIEVEIIGNVFVVTVNTNGSDSLTMASWGRTLSQLGFYPLLTSTLIFIRKWFNPEYPVSLQRIRTWKKIDPRLKHYKQSIRFLHILLFAAFVCSLLGGLWSNPGSSKVTSGQNLQKVGNIIFIVAIIAILTFVVYLSISSVNAAQRHDQILIQILIVMPILLIRSSFAAVQAFIRPGEPNIWLNFGLLQIPDLLSDTIYTVFGLALLKPAQRKELIREWKSVSGSVGVSRRRKIWERIVGRIRRSEEAMDEVKNDNP